MLIRVGISCCFVLLLVTIFVVYCSGSTTSVGEERASFSAIVSCNFVVFVLGRFLFLLVLGMDCAFLLWHSLGLPLIILKRNILKDLTIMLMSPVSIALAIYCYPNIGFDWPSGF